MTEANHSDSREHLGFEEHRYRELLENTRPTVTIVDRRGAPLWTSARSSSELGYVPAVSDHADLFSLVRPDDRAEIYRALALLLDDPDVDGISITAQPVGPKVDVQHRSEEREAELEAALAASANFVAGLSHEIRGQLHAILGMAELLLNGGDHGLDDRFHIESIHREANALRALIDDLLDLSTLSAGRVKVLNEPFSPGAVVDAVATAQLAAAQAKGLKMSVTIDPHVPRVVLGDEVRIRQVLVNLVTNAVKYTDVGSIEISVLPYHDGQTRFSVIDTGRGVPHESRDRIFELYAQAHEGDSRTGTGIGLAITRQLAELMNGSVTLESGSSGSAFHCDLRLQPASRKGDMAADRPRVSEPVSAGSHRILVVDDSEMNRAVASSQIERLGHQPTVVSGGLEAIELLTTERFDLILMDWQMPEMDGLETTRRIRANEGPERRVPIVAVTASALSGDRQTCLEAGMDDYLSKPIGLQTMADAIATWSGTADAPKPLAPARVKSGKIDELLEDLGDPSIVATLIDTFLHELTGWHRDIEEGTDPHAADSDLARVRRAAHSLMSTAALLGAESLAATSGQLEEAARTKAEPADLAALAADFRTAADTSRSQLSAIRDRLLADAQADNKRERRRA